MQEPTSEWDTPRVSPYRLAAHLTSAFVIYSGLFWTSLNLFYPLSATAKAPTLAASGAAALRKAAHPLAALIGITAVSGQLGFAVSMTNDLQKSLFTESYTEHVNLQVAELGIEGGITIDAFLRC